jgi:hypothetical protein
MSPRRSGLFTIALFSLALASCKGDDAGGEAAAPAVQKCNGHAELCDRRFDQVSFPATHNSMSNADEKWGPPNQNHAIGRQLDDGIRAFLIDSHLDEDGIPSLCHATCKLGSIGLTEALTIYRTFLEAHPDEVITLIIEDYITAAATEQSFKDSGLVKYVYTHEAGSAWPTLRQMIAQGTRVLVTAESGAPPPVWYQHVWDLAFDTPYTYASVAEIEATGCDANRGQPSNPLFLVNHWIGDPLSSDKNATLANPYAVLAPHAKGCRDKLGRLPNFVAVDFYDIGDLFRVVDELNGF